MSNTERYRCPYADCGFEGTEAQVDDHRATGVHDDQPQAGSNLRAGTVAHETTTNPHNLRAVGGFEIRLAVEYNRDDGAPTARGIHDVIADFIEQAPGVNRLASLSVVPLTRRDPGLRGARFAPADQQAVTAAVRIEVLVDQAEGEEIWVYVFRNGVGGFAQEHGIEVYLVDPGMFDHDDPESFEDDLNEIVGDASDACAEQLRGLARTYWADHVAELRRQTKENVDDGD